jgi:hypothetical protein
MKGINFVTNDKGEKIALQLDLKNPDEKMIELIEEIEDIIDVDLRKNSSTRDYIEIREELKEKGIISNA